MSIQITTASDSRSKMSLNATNNNSAQIVSTIFSGWIIDITGSPKIPFIHSTEFNDCTIIADDLKSFERCTFNCCELIIKDMPLNLSTDS